MGSAASLPGASSDAGRNWCPGEQVSPLQAYGFCLAELYFSQCGDVSSWVSPFPSLWG